MFVIATAGHVDHGKSTLVRALTGQDPDRWAEERRRGLTIDLGFASTTLPDGQTAAFVDVPGHRRFVPNMLAGIGSVPAVLFVVAADDGWMPQSQEHLDAFAALGVGRGVLAITRSDLFEPDLALGEARAALAGTGLARMPAVAVSATTGAGMDDVREALMQLGRSMPAPDTVADVRLWVDRSFTIDGAGTVVTGTLGAGTLSVGDVLTVGAQGRKVVIRGLQSLGRERPEVTAPARVAVNLRGVASAEVPRGTALLSPARWRETVLVDVRLSDVRPDSSTDDLPARVVVHCGSAAVPARARPLGDGCARLTLTAPLPLRLGDRLILREPAAQRITAGAVVLDPAPSPLLRRGDARKRAAVLAASPIDPDLGVELRRRGYARAEDLRAWGVPNVPDSDAHGGWLLDSGSAADLADQLVELVREHGRRDPLALGLSTEAARRALGLPDARLVDAVLVDPRAAVLSSSDGLVVFTDSTGTLPTAVADAAAQLGERLRAAPFVAPTADELAQLGLGRRELASCARTGILTEVGPGIWLGPDAIAAAAAALRSLPMPFTPSQARQHLSTSRRVVMPLLEELYRRGLTHRDGDGGHVVTE